MTKHFDNLIRDLLFCLLFMVFALPSMAERVSSSQADKAFASALFPGITDLMSQGSSTTCSGFDSDRILESDAHGMVKS